MIRTVCFSRTHAFIVPRIYVQYVPFVAKEYTTLLTKLGTRKSKEPNNHPIGVGVCCGFRLYGDPAGESQHPTPTAGFS